MKIEIDDGYPTQASLDALRAWNGTLAEVPSVLDAVAEYFNTCGYGRAWREGKQWHFATGGWSGCEDVIEHLPFMVSAAAWQASQRGGKHIYTMNPDLPAPKPRPKWVFFVETPNPGHKTKWISVTTMDDRREILGVVRWYGPWRKYAFFPNPNTLFEETCLTDIATFCHELTTAHRAARTARAQPEETMGG